jgi:release factor glutamine methyltransferase
MPFWSIGELLKASSDYLKGRKIDSPRLTAEVLLAHQLASDRVSLYLHFDSPINESDLAGYRSLVSRRARGEPLHYITGVREFWSLDFLVDPRVLIPRPETELLVEFALKTARDSGRKDEILILDLGTGSGAIAVSIAREIPGCRVWATDISTDALSLASENAGRHGVEDRIAFLSGDLFKALKDCGLLLFDIILSNPPYVAEEEWDALPNEVKYHEPRLALDGGTRGMKFLDPIVRSAHEFLRPGGRLFLEMAPHQTDGIVSLMESLEVYDGIDRIRDYSGRQRVVTAGKRL